MPKAEEIEETDFSKAKRALASAGPSKKGPKKHKVDSLCSMRFGVLSVCEDWDCMLNQTNIGHNNNKYYIIQLLQRSSGYVCQYVEMRRSLCCALPPPPSPVS